MKFACIQETKKSKATHQLDRSAYTHTLMESKHCPEQTSQRSKWRVPLLKKELGKWHFPPVLGITVTISSGRDVSCGGQGIGTVPLVPLSIDCKSNVLTSESPKDGGTQGEVMKSYMTVLLNTLHLN